MSLVKELVESGAVNQVRGYAFEAVRGRPSGTPKPARSPLSRAVATIRKEFDIPNTNAGYQAAYNVYRRAVRQAKRALKIENTYREQLVRQPQPPKPPPKPPPRGRKRDEPKPTMQEFTVFIHMRSPRSQREFRGTVTVTAPEGTPIEEIVKKAAEAVKSGKVDSPQSQKGGRNAGPFGESFRVVSWALISVEDIE